MTALAITRPVSASIGRCELSFSARVPIDLERARAQHAVYESTLRQLGCRVESLPAADELPDAVFVEDTAVILDELAVITRPGAASRRAETNAVADRLSTVRPLARIEGPATLDGGDVLRAHRTLLVGIGTRTTRSGAAALARLVEPLGYSVVTVNVTGCLHLKSAVSWLGEDRLLLDPERVDPRPLDGFRLISVAPDESPAANALWVADTAVIAAGYPRTLECVETLGLPCLAVDNSELAKAEGGLTCCSLIVESSEPAIRAKRDVPKGRSKDDS
ncbi:MAG: dimethylargininase [Gammaproteobacteria bacterium]|nr:MAG: dimethylargininase [Gammaproteobacteria bacterium]